MGTHHKIKYNNSGERVIEGKKRKKMCAIARCKERAVFIETLDDRNAK
jgi:hypothetical protein